jgi:ABC-type multidrug transport system permease subunit
MPLMPISLTVSSPFRIPASLMITIIRTVSVFLSLMGMPTVAIPVSSTISVTVSAVIPVFVLFYISASILGFCQPLIT